jgi:drug/metabolite transporter (DMT)-like permease
MTQTSLNARAWIDMALLAAIWGASFLSIKLALAELPVMTLVAHRVVWAALVLWAYVLWRGLAVPKDARIWTRSSSWGVSTTRSRSG